MNVRLIAKKLLILGIGMHITCTIRTMEETETKDSRTLKVAFDQSLKEILDKFDNKRATPEDIQALLARGYIDANVFLSRVNLRKQAIYDEANRICAEEITDEKEIQNTLAGLTFVQAGGNPQDKASAQNMVACLNSYHAEVIKKRARKLKKLLQVQAAIEPQAKDSWCQEGSRQVP